MASLQFLGISAILFFLTYGILWLVMTITLGQFYSLIGDIINSSNSFSPEWVETYLEIETTLQYIMPLLLALGIVIITLKTLTSATARGGE